MQIAIHVHGGVHFADEDHVKVAIAEVLSAYREADWSIDGVPDVGDALQRLGEMVGMDVRAVAAQAVAELGATCEGYNVGGRWVDCDRPMPHPHGMAADIYPPMADPTEVLVGGLTAFERGERS